ncbi:MAG: TIGR00266 family protein [Candidatus Iainarchaeum archaeon]|uniref:TIGR00266 family protein n=1 Tax=Candidatus Iainarchaeum sp. TaxID=3101447 RepID=A0A7T9DJP6_9ARCH|nr:MAG: TIGR00266 family protein [Candidatus Diapherotrites archaeon]
MKYKIQGEVMQTASIALEKGQTIYAEASGMQWMTDNVEMKSKMRGGLGAGIGRMFTGESLFLNEFNVKEGNSGMVTFSSDFPGKIMAFDLKKGQTIIAQSTAFLAADDSVTMQVHFQKKLGAGFFGGEGFILQKITGPGTVLLSLDGEITNLELEKGQRILCDPGSVAVFDPAITFDIQRAGDIKTMIFGGEGLFLASLEGPGEVHLQSMQLSDLAQKIAPMVAQYIPRSGNGPTINFGK